MKFFKCINKMTSPNTTVNMFLKYSFYNGNIGMSNNDHTIPQLQYGYIYRTLDAEESIIEDEWGRSYKVANIMEYLEPYELVIDDMVKRLIERKKNDEIVIIPYFADGETTVYDVSITVPTRKNKTRVRVQISGKSIYDCLIYCYRRLELEIQIIACIMN